jgi:hypothetical protein
VADGLLLTRRERLKLFWGGLGGGMGPSLLLAVVVAALGGVVVALLLLQLVIAWLAGHPIEKS